MSPEQVQRAFGPHVSFKNDSKMLRKRGQAAAYRGYKGVGLTFLAYGTDDVALHSKQETTCVKGRMQHARTWTQGQRSESAVIVEDTRPSPLDSYARGTLVRVHFSASTRPRSLAHLASAPKVWPTILRNRTAIGQILGNREPVVKFEVRLTVIDGNGSHSFQVQPAFHYPHLVARKPPFRFLDLPEYYRTHSEQAKPPAEKLRQDGVFLHWDTERIRDELTAEQKTTFEAELEEYAPMLYAFIPYQGSVWGGSCPVIVERWGR